MSNWAQEYLIKEASGTARLARLFTAYGGKRTVPPAVLRAIEGGMNRLIARGRGTSLGINSIGPADPDQFGRIWAGLSRALAKAPNNRMIRKLPRSAVDKMGRGW